MYIYIYIYTHTLHPHTHHTHTHHTHHTHTHNINTHHTHTHTTRKHTHTYGPRYLSRYGDSLRTVRFGRRIPVGTRISSPVQTGPGAHPAFYSMRTGFSPGSKVAGAWRPAERKSTSILLFLLWAFVACSSVYFTFIYIYMYINNYQVLRFRKPQHTCEIIIQSGNILLTSTTYGFLSGCEFSCVTSGLLYNFIYLS